jgi:hypothetical protein
MARLDTATLQQAITAAGHTWRVREWDPTAEPHALGRERSPAGEIRRSVARAEQLLRARVVPQTPPLAGAEAPAPIKMRAARRGWTLDVAASPMSLAAAAASIPRDMDWRTRGVIGPVLDQGNCGSCVSFATTGLAAAQAEIELGIRGLTLSAADQHFCSSHGAHCSGWNNADGLGQIQSRGVVEESDFPYLHGFDSPPQDDPHDPEHLWLAYCRPELNRAFRRWRISDYHGWRANTLNLGFDARKFYLANYGPMVLGFTVYQDFDHYAGGVYTHTSGTVRGGHAVLVIGYSDTNNAWICRNSWGTGFGGAAQADGTGAGFFMIRYGDSNSDNEPFYGCHGVIVPQASRYARRVGDTDADGRTEILVSSPWGIGLLKQAGSTMAAPAMKPNGTRFGGWLLNTADNAFGPMADFDGDGHAEVLVTSPWGAGILKQSGSSFAAPMMQPNGTRFGGWNLNTADDKFGPAADFDGDGRAEILVANSSGIALLKQHGTSMDTLVEAANGTRFGGWLLNTADNVFGPAADFDGDGHAELLVTSPWGIGLLKLSGSSFAAPIMARNGTRFGGWLLNTADNNLGWAGDYDGDGRPELLISSPWGLGILKVAGSTFAAPMMRSNGTRFGGWLLNTADNDFGPAADFDGDGHAEVLVSSPWGIGILKQSGSTMTSLMLKPNGTRFGGWLLNTADNHFHLGARYDGTPAEGLLVTSPWGIGLLKLSGTTMSAPMMQPNGTRFGGWLLNTADNEF